MAKRTVINKALKLCRNSSGDGWLNSDKRDEMDSDTAAEERGAKVAAGVGSRTIDTQDVEFEEVHASDTVSEAQPENDTTAEAENAEPPYAQ